MFSYARMKGKKRSELALAAFRAEDGPRALMLPVKTGAHGLNLVEANHVFILEPLLNAAVEAQAVNRVHRGGQRRPTTIHRLVVLGTIEEDIARLREKKHNMLRVATGSPIAKGKARNNSNSGSSQDNIKGRSKGKGKESVNTQPRKLEMSGSPSSSSRHAAGVLGELGVDSRLLGAPGSPSRHGAVHSYDDDEEQDGGEVGGRGSGQTGARSFDRTDGMRRQNNDGCDIAGEEEEQGEEEEDDDDGLPALSSLTASSDEKQAFTLDDLKILLCCATGDR